MRDRRRAPGKGGRPHFNPGRKPGQVKPVHTRGLLCPDMRKTINTMNIFKSLLSADRDSLSSKRLCGIIGWLCCSAVLIMCTVWDRQAPDMISAILYASTALLGIDSVTDIWKGSVTINKDKNEK